jgi:hypothetical protein
MGKANYARYQYADPGNAQHTRYFDANYIEFMYSQFDIAMNKINKGINVVGATANLIGAGALAKSELNGLTNELSTSISETENTGQIPTESTSTNTISHRHHIATNKNLISTVRGGPWTPRFKAIFENAGLDIDKGPENIVDIINHKGPHPQEYHELVFSRLRKATIGLKPQTDAYKSAVVNTLQEIGKEAQTLNTQVNKLLTKQ